MNKRQIIILVVMVLLAIYGGYTYLFDSPAGTGRDEARQTGELNRFVEETSRLIKAGKLSRQEEHSLSRTESAWQRDPFYAPALETREHEKEIKVEEEFVYSGFLEGGGTRIAIINGLEYEAGETLQGERFVLQGISPGQVVIGIMGEKQTLTVPFSE